MVFFALALGMVFLKIVETLARLVLTVAAPAATVALLLILILIQVNLQQPCHKWRELHDVFFVAIWLEVEEQVATSHLQ